MCICACAHMHISIHVVKYISVYVCLFMYVICSCIYRNKYTQMYSCIRQCNEFFFFNKKILLFPIYYIHMKCICVQMRAHTCIYPIMWLNMCVCLFMHIIYFMHLQKQICTMQPCYRTIKWLLFFF